MRVPDPGSGIRARGEGESGTCSSGVQLPAQIPGSAEKEVLAAGGNGSLGAVTGAQTRSPPDPEGTEGVGELGPPSPGSGEGGGGARIPHLPAVPGGSPR